MSPQQNLGDDEAGRLKALQIAMMLALPFSLKAAVNLGVPKILVDAGSGADLTAEDIATSIAKLLDRCADATNLDRILRVLASHNVLTEIVSKNGNDSDCPQRSYGPTSTLKYFTDNEDGVSLAPFLLMATDTVILPTFQYLHLPVLDVNMEPHVLVHGMNPSIDVGGGLGATLAMILSKYPKIRGINFDQPHVVADGLQVPNLELVGGDFFASVPEADAVFMKVILDCMVGDLSSSFFVGRGQWILHDWDDEQCVKILKNVWRALPPHGKVINLDYVLSDNSDPSPATKISLCTDISMMAVNSNGRERTLAQFKRLAADAGFRRIECVAQIDDLSLLEFYKN
ncbi:hypothetical protein AXG93_3488s1000 [Marchantia polymorpha subsp. ruderalis]|uniref:O-methyltransferase domain-containing protein n=1 Tax=Marchantia polymorpha subsp. ruderalis TaxID=1480154 RepID=A0A176W1L1_MARPO|nr:hypothetical protein AXG93_3488s1000 [Marchantia polymorpha subsp. ruderalis]